MPQNGLDIVDIERILQVLYSQKARIDNAIAQLESIRDGVVENPEAIMPANRRRGRKSMGETERREVSARMTKYWAQRRKQKLAISALKDFVP